MKQMLMNWLTYILFEFMSCGWGGHLLDAYCSFSGVLSVFDLIMNNSMATTQQKSKTVQNYTLECLKYVNPDQSQVWLARHKILKKPYMLKRVKYLKDTVPNPHSKQREDDDSAHNLQKIVRQIELLRQVKLAGAPRCQKMIKTTNCLYVVYDQFVGISITDYFRTHRTLEQKLKIMANITKALLSYHVKELVFLLLSPNNIFVQENQKIFFSEWSLAIYKNNIKNIFPVANLTNSTFIAREVVQESKYSPESDIFSLGQIFNFIIYNSKDKPPQSLKKLTEKMVENNTRHRPSLQQIIKVLQTLQKDVGQGIIGKSQLVESKSLLKSKALERCKIKRFATQVRGDEKEVSRSKNKDPLSQDKVSRQKSALQNQLIRSKTPTVISFDSILTGMSRTLTKIDNSRIKSNEALARKISKNRNLSYFMMELSQFASSKAYGEELGFLLLKQSYLILNNCYVEWSSQDLDDKKSMKLANILKEEIVQLNLSLNMLKEYFLSQQALPLQLKTELRNDLSINDKFNKEKTVSFGNEIMKEINGMINQNRVPSLAQLVNQLFATYMIVKFIEEGSYQKYWDKIYTPQFAFLKSQQYFGEEKKLGYRYLRSKITEILNKK